MAPYLVPEVINHSPAILPLGVFLHHNIADRRTVNITWSAPRRGPCLLSRRNLTVKFHGKNQKGSKTTAEEHFNVCQQKINIKANILSDWMMAIMRCLLFVTRFKFVASYECESVAVPKNRKGNPRTIGWIIIPSMPLGRPLLLKHSTIRYMVSVEDQRFFVNVQPPQLQEQRDDQYVALERRRNGSYVIGRLWCSWGAERGRGKGTFSRRFLEKQRRGEQAWLRPDMPSYEREKMMRRRVAPSGAVDRDPGPRLHDSNRTSTSAGTAVRSVPSNVDKLIRRTVLMIFAVSRRCDLIAEAPRKPTALCCGIPRAGVRVRAVQSSQNPEKAPGFTRAAVGETPRNSRIRLSPNIFCIRVVKDSRRLLLCGNDKGRLQRIGTFVIYPVDPGFCR
ncbi:Uncharacterized protein DBV15_08576, partial [Temnothorax longispinosus]